MPWGGLNPALTSWREGINARFPNRGRASDGGYADALHGSTSQHQADADGTVDAFDMDVNLLGSALPQGTTTERRLVEALKLDFELDARSRLWIHMREIASQAIDTWRERPYDGANPHDKHVHWETDQGTERDARPWRFTHTDRLIGELFMTPAQEAKLDALADTVAQLRATLATIPAAVWNHREPNPFLKGDPDADPTRRVGADVAHVEYRAQARHAELLARLPEPPAPA